MLRYHVGNKVTEMEDFRHAAVRKYYDSFGEREWLRLTNPNDGAVEWLVNSHTITKYLPPSPVRILDIGGGPGRYAIWLAKMGYDVVLADISPELIAIAKTKIVESGLGDKVETTVADACDLSRWGDESFHAVLSMGPFYHLPEEADRIKAATEMLRVLKRGGTAFIALMPLYALIRRTLALQDENHHLKDQTWLEALLHSGHFSNDVSGRFDGGYGINPEEVKPFFEAYGFESLALISSESITVGIQHLIESTRQSDLVAYEAAMQIILDVAADPSILGLASHLLYVARKN